MQKKIADTNFAGVETNDPAFAQMMANLDNLPNIDIDPYASEQKTAEEDISPSASEYDVTAGGGGVIGTMRHGTCKVLAKASSQRAMTAMPISEQGRDSINMAKQLYCKYEGRKMTREEFLLMMIEKSLRRMSPKAYDRWLLFRDC